MHLHRKCIRRAVRNIVVDGWAYGEGVCDFCADIAEQGIDRATVELNEHDQRYAANVLRSDVS